MHLRYQQIDEPRVSNFGEYFDLDTIGDAEIYLDKWIILISILYLNNAGVFEVNIQICSGVSYTSDTRNPSLMEIHSGDSEVESSFFIDW